MAQTIWFSVSHCAGFNHQLTQLERATLSSPLPLAGDLASVCEANLEVSTSGRYLTFLTLKIWAGVAITMIKR